MSINLATIPLRLDDRRSHVLDDVTAIGRDAYPMPSPWVLVIATAPIRSLPVMAEAQGQPIREALGVL